MKLITVPTLLSGVLLLLPADVFAQGTLTPPGAPAPTMKTLTQIEPRTAIAASTATVTISTDGSYYLTGDIAVTSGDGVTISANNVTLNLNGFTIRSSATSNLGNGVSYNGAGNFVVRNGRIFGTVASGSYSGFNEGVYVNGNAVNPRVEDLQLNTLADSGVDAVGNAVCTASRCQVNDVGGGGILAPGGVVDHCSIQNCTGDGISARTVESSNAVSLNGSGISSTGPVNNCYGAGYGSGGYGIDANEVTNSIGVSYGEGGVSAVAVLNSYGYCSSSNAAAGVQAITARGCQGQAAGNCIGVSANTVADCYGTADTAAGISGGNVTNSNGMSNSGTGIKFQNATNCQGYSSDTSAGSAGMASISSNSTATGCYGSTLSPGPGLSATNVINSTGTSSKGSGIVCLTATNSYGQSGATTNSYAGIDCSANGVATGCVGTAGSAGAYSIRAKIANGCSLVTGSTAGITHNINSF